MVMLIIMTFMMSVIIHAGHVKPVMNLKYDLYIGDDICKLQPFFGDFTMAFPTRGVKIKV